METITVDNDIKVFYVTAKSFPNGVLEAHQKLHQLVPFSPGRNYFGISRPERGQIVYYAAANERSPGEAEKLGCDTLVLRKGEYVSETVGNFRKHLHLIGETFQKLLTDPRIDPQGYCVELYSNDDESVKCMVRIE